MGCNDCTWLLGWLAFVWFALGWLAGLAWAGLPSQLGWAWLGLADELAGRPDGLGWLDSLGQAPESCPRHPKRISKWSLKKIVFISIWKGPFEDHVLLT